MNLAGKTVLYTGAAGGLGHDTSLALVAAGARVIAIDNNPEKATRLQTAAGNARPGSIAIETIDLGDLDGLARRLQDIAAREGGFDVVINNAAVYPSKPIESFTVAEHQAVQRVNVDAALVCLQAALPQMKRRGWGRVVNISSITFYGGWGLLSPYVASKAALVGLTRAWARELGEHGITVNCIAPGAFPTDAEKIHPDPDGYTRYVLEHQSLKRRGSAHDIANAILFFVSEQSSFVTGQLLNVDGGWVMH